MSVAPKDSPRAEPAEADSARSLFEHEVRREGRVVVKLRALQTTSGITVESEVFPITQAPGEGAMTRPFTFTTLEHARRFTDEALVALEYLSCVVS